MITQGRIKIITHLCKNNRRYISYRTCVCVCVCVCFIGSRWISIYKMQTTGCCSVVQSKCPRFTRTSQSWILEKKKKKDIEHGVSGSSSLVQRLRDENAIIPQRYDKKIREVRTKTCQMNCKLKIENYA